MNAPRRHQNGPAAQSDDSRSQIIQAVWLVIAQQGMGAVSMRNVAAAAEVSVGRIQYWFDTKDDLIRASLAAMLTGAQGQYEFEPSNSPSASAQPESAEQQLWQLIGHPIPQAATSPGGVSVFHHYVGAAINDPVLAQLLARAKDGQEREATRLVARLAPSLPDPRRAARALIATADGLSIRVLIGSLTAPKAQRTLRAQLALILD